MHPSSLPAHVKIQFRQLPIFSGGRGGKYPFTWNGTDLQIVFAFAPFFGEYYLYAIGNNRGNAVFMHAVSVGLLHWKHFALTPVHTHTSHKRVVLHFSITDNVTHDKHQHPCCLYGNTRLLVGLLFPIFCLTLVVPASMTFRMRPLHPDSHFPTHHNITKMLIPVCMHECLYVCS